MTGPERDKAEYFVVDPLGWEKLLNQVRDKKIEHRDLTVLLSIASQANKMTGAYFGSAAAAIERCGLTWKSDVVSHSVTRLKKADLVKRLTEPKTRRTYYVINPRVVFMGSDQARQRLWQKWRSEAD